MTETTETEKPFDAIGFTAVPSTAKEVKIIMGGSMGDKPIIGKTIYITLDLDDAEYLSLGLVTNVTTHNENLSGINTQELSSKNFEKNVKHSTGINVRIASVQLQSTFRREPLSDEWSQYGASLPTSPDAYTRVRILSEEKVFDIINREDYAFLGHNHQSSVLSPFSPVKFSDSSGATHTAVFAKSGAGKSVFCSYKTVSNMRDPHRAVLVVDPQGQWSSEMGFLFSPQAAAKAMGREVFILKISEDIQLSPDQDLIEKILEHSGMWKRFKKMGKDIQEILSTMLAENMIYHRSTFKISAREVLTQFFDETSAQESQLKKIYSSDDRRLDLKNRMLELLHKETLDHNGEVMEVSEQEYNKASKDFDEIVASFTPVHNLFTKENIYGRKRKPLTGYNGTLSKVLTPRDETDGPAPYVVVDMSTNKSAQSLAEFTGETSGDKTAVMMTRLLGNNDVKTVILKNIFSEMTSIAEEAFAMGGNLNTEILFDEAMRFAMPPNSAGSDDAKDFTNDLAEYARDTRKFGIGWTYILQTPTGLNIDIFKQLTNTYVGWGLSGKDLQMIGEQMDGKDYLNIYTSFAPPRSTKRYPFMMLGTTSPLVFTSTPSFIDVFTDVDSFIEANSQWLNELGIRYGKGTISVADISHESGKRQRSAIRKSAKIDKSESPSNVSDGEAPKKVKKLVVANYSDEDDGHDDSIPVDRVTDWSVEENPDAPPF